MFYLHKHFSKASVFALFLAAILIGALYYVTVDEGLRETARVANAMLARSIINRIEPDVQDIGRTGIDTSSSSLLSDPRIRRLAGVFSSATRDLPVLSSSLVTEDGWVLSSSDQDSIGHRVTEGGRQAILAWDEMGQRTVLGYRFDEDRKGARILLTTVAPLAVDLPDGRSLLFLMTENMEGLFAAQNRRRIVVFSLGGGVFLALYLFLFKVVRQGERILTAQREEIEGQVILRTRELRESRERMADVAEASSDWFWETGPDHRYTWFSLRGLDRGQGLDIEALKKLSRQDLIDCERTDPEALAAHLEDLATHRPFRDFTYWGRQPRIVGDGMEGGEKRLVRVSGKPRFDAAGRFLGYRGLAEDITDQKEVEERAHRAERRLAEAIDGIPDGVALWDREDRLVLWNNAYETHFPRLAPHLKPGLPFDAAVRLNLGSGDALVTEDEGPGIKVETGERGIQTRIRRHREASGVMEVREGSGRWVRITESRVTDGQILSIFSDVTRRKVSETELEASETCLRIFLGITSDTSSSLEERFKRILELGAQRFDLENGFVIERGGADFRFVQGIGPLVDISQRTKKPGESLSGICLTTKEPVIYRDTDAPEAYRTLPSVQVMGLRSYIGIGLCPRTSITGVLAFFSTRSRPAPFTPGDIQMLELMAQWVGSELFRRDSEGVIRSAMEQAELANRAKSEFLANMSHELRTPLNAIIGFSEVMGDEVFGALGSERYKEYVRAIHDSGYHLLHIINDILDVSKIEAGHMVLSEEPLALVPLIEATLRLIAERAQDGGVRLERDLADPSPRAHVDGRRMKQVLINVLSNAVKFTPQGGAVRVSMQTPAPGQDLEIAVSDTGMGMKEEEILVALSPFGQIDSGLSRRHEGTGLGLPLAKSLMDMHGGSLTLQSVPGQGTVVTLTLPQSRLLESPERTSDGTGA
ncbi:ATP-binding protein [Rhodospirillum sp. A1_3_36]|uniref:ATP-binding protein n=1 Tax=Rhodospirillum sp. A1_3_36 TaxID=3391666 RepID=UPI0039A54BA1